MPSRTTSRAPPGRGEPTGVPAASASTVAMPKSSSAACTKPDARPSSRASSARGSQPRSSTFGGRSRRSSRSSGPMPTIVSRYGSPRNASTTRRGFLYGTSRCTQAKCPASLVVSGGSRPPPRAGGGRARRGRTRRGSARGPLRDGHVCVGPGRLPAGRLGAATRAAARRWRQRARDGGPRRAATRSGSACSSNRGAARLRGDGRWPRTRGTTRRPGRTCPAQPREPSRHEGSQQAPAAGVVPALADARERGDAGLSV